MCSSDLLAGSRVNEDPSIQPEAIAGTSTSASYLSSSAGNKNLDDVIVEQHIRGNQSLNENAGGSSQSSSKSKAGKR